MAGLSWPVPESVDDAGLERRLFPAPPPSRAERPLPDWSEVHRELRRKSVTLALLWQEYKESHERQRIAATYIDEPLVPASSTGCRGGGHRSVETAGLRSWLLASIYWPDISGPRV